MAKTEFSPCLFCGGDSSKPNHLQFCPGVSTSPPPGIVVCPFCGGDPSEPQHDQRCDGKQGGRDHAPDVIPSIPPVFMPPFNRDSDAFAGLAAETLNAIRGAVPQDMVLALVGYLTDTPRHADEIRIALAGHPWFPSHAKRDSQLRRMRTIRDAAIAWGYPVCTTNAGYALGTWEQVIGSAVRARRFAAGAYTRAAVLEVLAEKLRVV